MTFPRNYLPFLHTLSVLALSRHRLDNANERLCASKFRQIYTIFIFFTLIPISLFNITLYSVVTEWVSIYQIVIFIELVSGVLSYLAVLIFAYIMDQADARLLNDLGDIIQSISVGIETDTLDRYCARLQWHVLAIILLQTITVCYSSQIHYGHISVSYLLILCMIMTIHVHYFHLRNIIAILSHVVRTIRLQIYQQCFVQWCDDSMDGVLMGLDKCWMLKRGLERRMGTYIVLHITCDSIMLVTYWFSVVYNARYDRMPINELWLQIGISVLAFILPIIAKHVVMVVACANLASEVSESIGFIINVLFSNCMRYVLMWLLCLGADVLASKMSSSVWVICVLAISLVMQSRVQ